MESGGRTRSGRRYSVGDPAQKRPASRTDVKDEDDSVHSVPSKRRRVEEPVEQQHEVPQQHQKQHTQSKRAASGRRTVHKRSAQHQQKKKLCFQEESLGDAAAPATRQATVAFAGVPDSPAAPQTAAAAAAQTAAATPPHTPLRTPPHTPPQQVRTAPPPSAMRTYPRSILTPGRRRSPRDRTHAGAAADTPRKSVVFHNVVVREYDRLHNGSGGVPVDGAYPLGLGWAHAADVATPVAAYEVARTPKRRAYAVPLSEAERRALLHKFDDTLAEAGAAEVVQRVGREICALQASRQRTPGCRCRDGRCVLGSCPCYASGLPCLESYCTCCSCHNPFVGEDRTDPALLAAAQELQKKYAERASSSSSSSGDGDDGDDGDDEAPAEGDGEGDSE